MPWPHTLSQVLRFELRLIPVWIAMIAIVASAEGRPVDPRHELAEPQLDLDRVGVTGTGPTAVAVAPRKALQDTIWIAEWTFDTGAPCDFSGWEQADHRILNDGVVYWDLDASFDGSGAIVGTAAALGYENDPCCEDLNGYRDDWYQAIRIEYTGAATVSFDYLLDSEGGFDFLHVEEDSACSSFDRVELLVDPSRSARSFRDLPFPFMDSGFIENGNLSALTLRDFGPGTHCLYIAFFSDGGFSPCDGLQPTTIGKALVIDNIVITDASGTRSEDFEDGSFDLGTFVNIQESATFGPTDPGRNGSWARTYSHITDNDLCTENSSCAVLWTDDTTPTIANDPSMAFGPGGYVVRNWLDDVIISPWVSLASTPNANATILQFRRFPGNFFSNSRIVQNWSIRGKTDADDGMGGTAECISGWGHSFQWNSLSLFGWIVPTASGNPPNSGYDASLDFDPSSKEIQVRHRTSDWQWITGAPPPAMFIPGPGPFIDRTRIGRQVLTGPVLDEGIDARQQAQDCFPTEIDPLVTPGTGEHHRPSTDRFGTAAFSRAHDLTRHETNLVIGDSISVEVKDVRGAGSITTICVYGVIVAGPHAGKAPPPHAVGANGFFVVPADTARTTAGTPVRDNFFVDVDDFYFRGGDVLNYVWIAVDALGGVGSVPAGLTTLPSSVEEVQDATQGMFEVSFLPTIDWSPAYLARIAADPHGKLVPTQEELDNSSQATCILYYQGFDFRRRSGDVNRTSFMYTLDVLGYRGRYDVYDHQGMGNTNNQLGGRATLPQVQGYNLIVYDVGNRGPSSTILPDGLCHDAHQVDQVSWFRDWLAQGSISEAGSATLWILGSNALESFPANALYSADMGLVLNATSQASGLNPDVQGLESFAFENSTGVCVADFTGDSYSVNGGCHPDRFAGGAVRDYDALGSSGTAVSTHLYRSPETGALGDAAIVMNANAAANWNTIMQSHPWFDIADTGGVPASPSFEEQLLARILGCVLPPDCQETPNPTGVPGDDELDAIPRVTTLHANVPNPFNPTTTIRFDLARAGRVALRIYDVGGRLVRTLVDEELEPRRHTAVWNGMSDDGRVVPSGVYVYRLSATGYEASRKMLVLR